MAPSEQRLRVVPGVELAVRRWRPGGRPAAAAAPLLLVHGLASNARMWDGVAAHLAAEGHDVGAVDLRGHGRSGRPDGGYDTPTVAADLAPLLDRLGWPRAVLAGQSWGANVVLQVAADAPERVAALACVDGGFGDLAERFPDWADCARVLAPPRLSGLTREELLRRVRAGQPGLPGLPEAALDGVLGCFEPVPGTDPLRLRPRLGYERHLQVLRGLWEHRPSAILPRLGMPVLFVLPEDRAAPALGRLAPAARVHRIAGGHDLHAEHPLEVARLLAGLARA